MIKKIIILIACILFTGTAWAGPAIELDYMEYATDVAARAAYATSDEGIVGSDEIPDMTSNTTPSGTVSCNEGSALAWYTMDDSASYTSVTQWIQYQFTAGKTINRYTITSKVGTPVYGPVAWILKGSNDGSAWTDLDTQAEQSFSEDETKTYDFDNATSYTYYRIYITSHGGSGFSSIAEIELIIYDVHTQSYSESTIKEQGSYSLNIFADKTNSLNDTLTRTISTPIDLSNRDTIYFSARASRTGSNFKVTIHDSGGTSTEHAVNIASANTWQDETWDISGVATANKDAIDSIIITITNADADNTFYIDNIRTEVPAEIEGTPKPSRIIPGPTDYEQKQEVWDNPDEDSIVGDVLGFEPVETLDEIPDSWPKWAVSRFFRLDPAAQKATMDRQRRADIEKLKETPYSTIKRSQSKQWEIENSWMSRADRESMMWVKEPLTFDRKRGSRYLYVNIPKFSYYTKMFVYGEDAEIVQDFQGHGAITKFDETKLLRVDVFDGTSYIGTAYNAPIAKWVKVWSELGGDPGQDADVEALASVQDQGDSYVVNMINRTAANDNETYLVYFKRDGEYVWEQELTIGAFGAYANRYGAVLINSDNDIVGMAYASDAGVANEQARIAKHKIKDGSVVWNTAVAGSIARDMCELTGGDGYVTAGGQTDAFPQNPYAYKYNESGAHVNWGNGSASLDLTELKDGWLYSVCTDAKGDIYVAGYRLWAGNPSGGWIGNFAGYTRGAITEGDIIGEDFDTDAGSIYDICLARNQTKVCGISILGSTNFGLTFCAVNGSISATVDIGIVAGTNVHPSIEPTDDGGFIICGESADNKMLLIKTNADGDVDWTQTFVEQDGWTAYGSHAIQTADGGYLAVGTSCPPSNYNRAYLVKTNSYGETCSKGEPCR